MDEQSVRDHARAHIDALRAGDIGAASQEMSPELQRHLGELVAMLPLPLTDAAIETECSGAGERSGSGRRRAGSGRAFARAQ